MPNRATFITEEVRTNSSHIIWVHRFWEPGRHPRWVSGIVGERGLVRCEDPSCCIHNFDILATCTRTCRPLSHHSRINTPLFAARGRRALHVLPTNVLHGRSRVNHELRTTETRPRGCKRASRLLSSSFDCSRVRGSSTPVVGTERYSGC